MMAAPKQSITWSKVLQNTFCESNSLTIGWGALQMTTQAPNTLFFIHKATARAKAAASNSTTTNNTPRNPQHHKSDNGNPSDTTLTETLTQTMTPNPP